MSINPTLFADRDLYNPTTFINGASSRETGLQTSRGCAEYGRREHEVLRTAPTCQMQVILSTLRQGGSEILNNKRGCGEKRDTPFFSVKQTGCSRIAATGFQLIINIREQSELTGALNGGGQFTLMLCTGSCGAAR